MGIVNVTPDSFSDGGRFFDPSGRYRSWPATCGRRGGSARTSAAKARGPMRKPVDAAEELRRVVPVVRSLAEQTRLSDIDRHLRKREVAREAIAAGAEVDQRHHRPSRAIRQCSPLAVETRAGVCAMHMRGTPQTMQDDPRYDDVVAEVLAYLRLAARRACRRRPRRVQRIAIDPGIGFGKTHQHSLDAIGRTAGVSTNWAAGARRPFTQGLHRQGHRRQTGRPTAGTIGVALSLAQQGVQIIRVHDVAAVRQALCAVRGHGWARRSARAESEANSEVAATRPAEP